MIKLKTLKQELSNTGIDDQFTIEANEPVVIEVINTTKGHLVAHIYKADDRSEPIGAYDSEVEQEDWAYFNPSETPEAPQWRVFVNNGEVGDIGYLSTSGASDRMLQSGFTDYHSFNTDADALYYAFEHKSESYSLKDALDRVYQIKTKLAKDAHS